MVTYIKFILCMQVRVRRAEQAKKFLDLVYNKYDKFRDLYYKPSIIINEANKNADSNWFRWLDRDVGNPAK